jgi:hypothetical protein
MGCPPQKSWYTDEYTVLDTDFETEPPSPLPDASKFTWAKKKRHAGALGATHVKALQLALYAQVIQTKLTMIAM